MLVQEGNTNIARQLLAAYNNKPPIPIAWKVNKTSVMKYVLKSTNVSSPNYTDVHNQ